MSPRPIRKLILTGTRAGEVSASAAARGLVPPDAMRLRLPRRRDMAPMRRGTAPRRPGTADVIKPALRTGTGNGGR
jgi:hypothetical protein